MNLFESEEVKNAIIRNCQKRIDNGISEDDFYSYLTHLIHTWRNNDDLINYIKGLTFDQFKDQVEQ